MSHAIKDNIDFSCAEHELVDWYPVIKGDLEKLSISLRIICKFPNFQMRGKRKSTANHRGSDSELSILPTFLVCWGIILLDLCMHGLHQSLCSPG